MLALVVETTGRLFPDSVLDRREGSRLMHRLDEHERLLRAACERLLAEAAAGVPLTPKATWLLDNLEFIQSQIREVREAMPRGYYRGLPRVRSGRLRGYPRVYRLATEALAKLGADLSVEPLAAFFRACQQFTPLLLAEVWAVGTMLRLALVEQLCTAIGDPNDPPTDASAVCPAIVGLRALETASWRDFAESVSRVERILREDPAGIYPHMEFEARDAYRHAVEGIAHCSDLSEEDVAQLAVELGREAAASGSDGRLSHVGYYLVDRGAALLKKGAGFRPRFRISFRDALYRWPNVFYLGGIVSITAAVMAALAWLLAPVPWWVVALALVPASQVAVSVVNSLVPLLVPPRSLARLDFSGGIPDHCRAFVVVPTLLLSRGGVEKLLERLEIHYLANRDPNLFLALLTDYPDSLRRSADGDRLLEVCAEGVRMLNERHGAGSSGPFYLFHRDRQWNQSESVWMGHERKRGKLVAFNRLLLGEADAFALKIGDLSVLPTIRYVITLDSDTQLPRDTARKLIATLAHPLNQPVVDAVTNTVRHGYAILQPRVSISMESAGRTRLARIYSGQTGFDPYTTAVSDVYQDLYAAASFTGKGIYDLRVFQKILGRRFPENTLLSHDLIEGEYARTALVTDLEVIDDYPTTHEAHSKRKHRWVRGDWQTLPWLSGRVPSLRGESEPNPLPLLSRWKILDNLRRSLLEIFLLVLLLAGWMWLPGRPAAWTLAVLALCLLPAYAELLLSLLRVPPRRLWASWFREALSRLAARHLDVLLNMAFLAHQACLMADAIVRTLARTLVTRCKLLEWESMAQAEECAGRRSSLVKRYLFAPPVLALLAALWLNSSDAASGLPILLLNLWVVCPLLADWLNGPPGQPSGALSEADHKFLHDAALRTWRYFNDLSGLEHNGLIPDNVQEDPPAVAARTSPTNLGLLLAANLAAHDFGYLTRRELAIRLDRVLQAMSCLERFQGHFYNWYDTRTLALLAPRYISTVDSGNLAAALLAIKQGCLELLEQPIIHLNVLSGLRDHCLRLRDSLPEPARSAPVMRLIVSLLRQLEYQPTNAFFWEGVLTEASVLCARMRPHVEWACSQLEAAQAAEPQYWYGALEARVEAALAELYSIAPWLAPPLEPELRSRLSDPVLAPLVKELDRIPKLSSLPALYDAIEAHVCALLGSTQPLHPVLRATLDQLLGRLPDARARAERLIESLEEHAATASGFVEEMDFRFLFDRKRKLLRIGHDADAGRFDDGYYDLLASEARSAVFVAIAKGDIPREAWFHLGRKLISYRGHRTLLSWSGTTFEYLLPCLFMRAYENTLLGESLKTAVRIQQLYGRERGVPWGISEAASSARDSSLHYRYQAFGVLPLGLKRACSDDLVVAPYASMLAVMVDCEAATANLREMAARDWIGRYGFYDSADYSSRRIPTHERPVLVRCFMAHHQAMGLLALANTLLGNPMQRRFHADPLVQATEYVLQERLPLVFASTPDEQPLPAGLEAFYRRMQAAVETGTHPPLAADSAQSAAAAS